jgi:diguanylate cyclase (GGDEF)-like protein
MLKEALGVQYKVTTCLCGTDAYKLMDSQDFDIVVTDLKLPDCTGIDVLSYSKGKDEYTEVIVITGFASLDSATLALNLGVYSYLVKPLSIPEFLIQIEKAIALRLFHLKSIMLMRQSDFMPPGAKDHIQDITQLYYFIRKLMLSIEVSEIMRITLEDVNHRMGSLLAVIGADLLGFSEIFAMPHTGVVESEKLHLLFSRNFNKIFPLLKKEKFDKEVTPLLIYKGKQGECFEADELHPVVIPLMVTDRSIGTLTLFFKNKDDFNIDQNQFLYVFTSIVSSIIEHGYSVLQARQQAKTDSLTGIANHRLFHETLEREIARSNRKGCTFSLILIDIDNFKKINDTYGHQVGDAVIVDLTRRIGLIIRAGDVLARYGGEEFGLILPETDLHGAEILASRILNAFTAKPLTYLHHKLSYSASIGVALYNGMMPVKKDILVRAADQALYDSKRNGKNRFTVGTITL